MKHDVTFVTCFYDDLHHSSLKGRLNRGTQYAFSLGQMMQMETPFICYTDSANFHKFAPSFVYHGADHTRFFSYNLKESPYHVRFNLIRDKNPEMYLDSPSWAQRCLEIMWGKFEFIKHAANTVGLDSNKMLYWIDAGLSHDGVIPKRYNSLLDTVSHPTTAHAYQYTHYNDLLFDKDFPQLIAEYTGEDKLLFLVSRNPQHSDPIPLPEVYKTYKGTIIGGLFGGNARRMYDLGCRGMEYCEKILDNDALVKEEDILTYMVNAAISEDENFKDTISTFVFDTWYHEDWNVFRPNQVSFSDFFKEIGK